MLKVVFMGTPQFAVPTLNMLAENFNLLCVVSQLDKPRGRGNVLQPTAVKARAIELGIPVSQPKRVRDEEFINMLRDLNPDVIVVAAYSRLIPDSILNLPAKGCINLHPSLLPRHRGAIPVQSAIISGDTTTGITTFLMDEGYDTGKILLQKAVPLENNISGTELLEKLADMGADVMKETLYALENGNVEAKEQVGEANYTKPLHKEDLEIQWDKSAVELSNFVRALHESPSAETSYIYKEQINTAKIGQLDPIVDMELLEKLEKSAAGTVVELNKSLGPIVACKDGYAAISLIKPAGKGWMSGKAFMAGRKIEKGTLFYSQQDKNR